MKKYIGQIFDRERNFLGHTGEQESLVGAVCAAHRFMSEQETAHYYVVREITAWYCPIVFQSTRYPF